MEEIQKKIQEEIAKKPDIAKKEKCTDSTKVENNIFRKQKMYTGEKPWIDPLFEPKKESLCPFNEKEWILPEGNIETDIIDWDKFDWARVEEIFRSGYLIYDDEISIDDIIQGRICDCYFLSALGSLCIYPELVKQLFYSKEITKEHLYGIYLYIHGKKKLVLVDDYLPCKGEFIRCAMSRSCKNELWVSLIEKAWAKVNGQYIRIGGGGTINEAFNVLTEAYSEEITIEEINTKDQLWINTLWTKLVDGEEKGFIMTAGTRAEYEEFKYKKKKL